MKENEICPSAAEQSPTNVERVTNYMEFGSAMNQLFLIHCLNTEAEKVVRNASRIRKEWKDSLINPDAWIASAKAWLKQENINVKEA